MILELKHLETLALDQCFSNVWSLENIMFLKEILGSSASKCMAAAVGQMGQVLVPVIKINK